MKIWLLSKCITDNNNTQMKPDNQLGQTRYHWRASAVIGHTGWAKHKKKSGRCESSSPK